ncbi:NADP-dependent oxidoreductase domain-containing protein [Podospora fimiseda]|uniref:NADP-dependent oxidoreductase domain-containing protein n=1 Tax=Podospora fimiseda TaxID=252190 RepID=A0AAN7BHW3_9PEZI|nr:NADP-dependent oxidoreductase domain-containing protein [Podospora fimiseda]
MSLPTHFVLHNGARVPAVGLGTFQGSLDNSKVKKAIDTAFAYGNEKEVGEAIKESGIPPTCHDPADVETALDLSVQSLGLDYVDLYLMHFSQAYKAGSDHETIRHPSGNGKPIIDYDLSRRYPETWLAISYRERNICLSWAVQRGIPVVPKSVQQGHMEQNLQLKRLPDELFQKVDALTLERGPIRFLDPSLHIYFDIFDEENDQPVDDKAPWDE